MRYALGLRIILMNWDSPGAWRHCGTAIWDRKRVQRDNLGRRLEAGGGVGDLGFGGVAGPAVLWQDAVSSEDSGHVAVAEDEYEHDDDGEADEVDEALALGGYLLAAADPLYDDE